MIVKTQTDKKFVSANFRSIQRKLLNKHSEAESKFASLLLDAGLWFRREKCNYRIGNRWSYYDFLIPALDLYIEIDGAEHLEPEQREIDNIKSIQISKRGHKIIRYTNKEVFDMDCLIVEDMIRRINEPNLIEYKRHRVECVVQSYVQQYSLFGDVINTPNIYLFDNEINAIFEFERLFDVNVATSNKTSDSIKMLSKSYNKKHSRFILTQDEEECRRIVRDLFGKSDLRLIKWQFPNYQIQCRTITVMSRDEIIAMTQISENGEISAFMERKIKKQANEEVKT